MILGVDHKYKRDWMNKKLTAVFCTNSDGQSNVSML